MISLYAAIMIGTNVADRREKMEIASRKVTALLKDARISSEIDSPDFTGLGNDYLNRVVMGKLPVATNSVGDNMSQEVKSRIIGEFRRELRGIEDELGRDRSLKGVVAADIDLVLVSTSQEFNKENTEVIAHREASTVIFKELMKELLPAR